MALDRTIWLREGNINEPAQANRNPSVAQATQQGNGISPMGIVKTAALMQGAKMIVNNTVSKIGEVTGDYELQEQAEAILGGGMALTGLVAAPIPTLIAIGGSTAFDVYSTNLKQQRNQLKQQQAQVLTGKISVNGGRF